MESKMKAKDLKKWRADNGYTQQALADVLGVPKVTVYRWECTGAAARRIPPFMHITLKCIEAKKGGEQKMEEEKKPVLTDVEIKKRLVKQFRAKPGLKDFTEDMITQDMVEGQREIIQAASLVQVFKKRLKKDKGTEKKKERRQ